MRKIFHKIRRFFTLLWFAFFQGMISADKTIRGNTSKDNNGAEINQNLRAGGVIDDIMENKVTQEVEELRDKMYRVYKESHRYDTSTITMTEEMITNEKGETEVVPVFHNTDKGMKKKTKADFMKRIKVFGEDTVPVRTIQDNYHFEKQDEAPEGIYDYDTTLTIQRGAFRPRFELEKFATKIVLRYTEGSNRAKVDLYLPETASQFGKIDAILIANLHRMYDTKQLFSDITDFEKLEWVSYKAWNCDDMCLFSFDEIVPEELNIFDGHFVLTFNCRVLELGKYLPEKYKTKGLDKKYAEEAPKKDVVDISAILRREKRKEKVENNLAKQILTLDENSNRIK